MYDDDLRNTRSVEVRKETPSTPDDVLDQEEGVDINTCPYIILGVPFGTRKWSITLAVYAKKEKWCPGQEH